MTNSVDILVKTKGNQYINIKFITVCSVVGLLNSFFYDSLIIMLVLCILEVAVLLFDLLKKNYLHYIAMYTVFLCFSMESETFVGSDIFYGFKNFRIAGLNLAVWMILPIILFALLNSRIIFLKITKSQKIILKKLISFTFVGFIMSLIIYLANDNGFADKAGSFDALINSLYTYILVCFELIAIAWCVSLQQEKIIILKQYLYSIIIGTSIVFMACFIFGNYGNRGGLQSLQVSDIYFLLVCSILLLVYDEINLSSKMALGISGMVILVLSLAFNASGKIVIISILIPIMMVVIMRKKGSAVKTIAVIFIAIIILVVMSTYIMPLLMNNSLLLTTKFEQAKSLFSFNSGDWFENLPASPKMRITEFMNIVAEYLKKPWYGVFGKGFCGTIKDNLGLFDELNEFSFSQWELQLGAYYTMHESINCFFLVGGFFGLYIIISILIRVFRVISRSPWLVFGFMWVLLFYNYHLSISIYGIVALIIGLYDIDSEIYSKYLSE